MSEREHTELKNKADAGDAHAKWLLAQRFLTQEPYNWEDGRKLLFEAASEGDAEAARVVAVLYACGRGAIRVWSRCYTRVARACSATGT